MALAGGGKHHHPIVRHRAQTCTHKNSPVTSQPLTSHFSHYHSLSFKKKLSPPPPHPPPSVYCFGKSSNKTSAHVCVHICAVCVCVCLCVCKGTCSLYVLYVFGVCVCLCAWVCVFLLQVMNISKSGGLILTIFGTQVCPWLGLKLRLSWFTEYDKIITWNFLSSPFQFPESHLC